MSISQERLDELAIDYARALLAAVEAEMVPVALRFDNGLITDPNIRPRGDYAKLISLPLIKEGS